ncbi:MAG: phage minor head protein, partial [Hydrogenophaga sp.]
MATAAQAFAALRRLTPEEALDYLRGRGLITQTYGWAELWADEHALQFTISRLANADLLADLQAMITESVAGDLSRTDFMRDARAALARKGWWGTSEVTDPDTGETKRTTFDPARLKLIYDTNTRQAYAAGQWERVEATRRTHPFLRYVTQRDEKVRASHRAWDGVTLPADDPFWATHYPPNGWRCRCRVVQVNRRDYERGTTPTGAAMKKEAPEVIMRDWLDKNTGEIRRIPAGIDPGFGYNAGMARQTALQQLQATKAQTLPGPIADAL